MADYLDMFDSSDMVDVQIKNVTPDPPEKTVEDVQTDLLLKYMEKYGITNNYIKAALMGIIMNEGGFKGVAEDMYYTTPGRLAEVYSVFSNYKNSKGQIVRAPEDQGEKYANELAKSGKYLRNPEALGNFVYANVSGNEGGTDGYRYRGRGPNQITGKGAYRKLGKELGVDLVNNPELLETDPDIQAHAAVKFLYNRLAKELPYLVNKYSKYKKRFGEYVDFNNIDNIEDANFILTSANAGFGKIPKQKTFSDRLAQAKKYESKFVTPEEPRVDEIVEEDVAVATPVEAKETIETIEPGEVIAEVEETAEEPAAIPNEISPKPTNTEISEPVTNKPRPSFIEEMEMEKDMSESISPLPVNIPKNVNTINPVEDNQDFINRTYNANNFSKEELKRQQDFKDEINKSIMDNNSYRPNFGFGSGLFGQGQLFGVDKKRAGGSLYSRYFQNGGSGDDEGDDELINPIRYMVDGATGNLKIYDPITNTFKVTNVPYEGDTANMQSHIGERFLGTDAENLSNEDIYQQLKMVQDFSNLEEQRAAAGREQLAKRTDILIGKKGKEFLPTNTYNFLAGNGGRSGCMAGSSGCFEPTEEQLADSSYINQVTIPYFLKSADDRYVKQILPFRNNTAPAGFRETYRNTEFRPNIFPTARVKNPNYGKINQSTGNVDNREYITKRTSKGNTRSEGSTQTPGGVLPTITGSATYIAQYPKLGLDEVAVGEPIEAGDRVTEGGRHTRWDGEGLADKIRRTGKSDSHHNYGIGTVEKVFDWQDDQGNYPKKFNVGAIGGNILFKPYFKRQEYGPESGDNTSGSGRLVTRYEGDTDYYNYIKNQVQSNLGMTAEEAASFIRNYEDRQTFKDSISKLPVISPGVLTNNSQYTLQDLKGLDQNTKKKRRRRFALGGNLAQPCGSGQIYDETVAKCVSYATWEKNNANMLSEDFTMKDVKKLNEEYVQTADWFKKYQESPRYKKMLRGSFPEGFMGDLAATYANYLRNQNLKNTPPLRVRNQEEDNVAGFSNTNSGRIVLYPEAVGTETGAHETSHSIDRPVNNDNRIIPSSDTKYIQEKKPKYVGDSRYYWNNKKYWDWLKQNDIKEYRKQQKEFLDWTDYVGEDTETRARLNTFRKLAQDRNIYDPFTEEVTPELYYNQIKDFKLIDDPYKEGYNPIEQLQDAFSDEEIIWMLNNISKAEPQKDINNDIEGMA